MNIGIDFGSTYSMFSIYDEGKDDVQPLMTMEGGSPYIPSFVCIAAGQVKTGTSARNYVGRKDVQMFKAFKMLLPETDPQVLKERGYSGQYSPQEIALKFLDQNLKIIKKRYGAKKFENLVICAPEVWSGKLSTMDGRVILRNLCRKLGYVGNVRVVSEPAAASAYFAYNYQKNTGSTFEGNVLIIDYGGGTLDITLTNVSIKSGSNCMQIKILERTGAGENQEGKIGSAGIAYMEDVVVGALREAGLLKDGEMPKYDAEFMKAVDSFEMDLQNDEVTICDKFDEYDDDLERILTDSDVFTTISYKDHTIAISYARLYKSYQDIIFPVLDKKLDWISQYMKEKKFQYMDGNQDTFKIALVGGFGKYDLVHRQVNEKFKLASTDKRLEGIGSENKESAISLGAALLAAGKITIRNTAPYSIGIYCPDQNGNSTLNYAINYREDIDFNRVYYIENPDGTPIFFSNTTGEIKKFVIGDNLGGVELPIRKELVSRLQAQMNDLSLSNGLLFQSYGFSMDESEVISFHIRTHEWDHIHNRNKGKNVPEYKDERVIELSNYNELFDLTLINEVISI